MRNKLQIGYVIPNGKGIVTRDAGNDRWQHSLTEFRCSACNHLHIAETSKVSRGGSIQRCERTRKVKEFQEAAKKQDRYTLEESFELAENKGPKTAARIWVSR